MICHFRKGVGMEYLEREIAEFRGSFCPYGYLDVKKTLEEAWAIGKDGDWAYEEVKWFAQMCDTPLEDVDPCYAVMDRILQDARNEIEELTGFDIQNDADFYTAGNYMATTYDWKSEDVEELTERLRPYYYRLERLSDLTKYWLSQVDIDYLKIEPSEDAEEDEEED